MDADEGYVAPLTASDYKELTDAEHVLHSPDMWIGSMRHINTKTWVFDNGRARFVTVSLPEGLCNMFREIIGNSCDNVDRSLRANVNPGMIEVNMDKTVVSVKNGGLPLMVDRFQDSNVYIPEALMSRMKAGSNFGTKRYGAGRNGMGAAIVNILSNYFEVFSEDAVRRRSYRQLWVNTDYYRKMLVANPPDIREYRGSSSFVTIKYQADLQRFDYYNGYPDEALGIFMRLAADASLACKIPVVFNNRMLNYTNILNYASMFFEPGFEYITYYQWPKGTEVIVHADRTQTAKNRVVLPLMETIIVDNVSPKVSISLCNSVFNEKGGAYMKPIYLAVLDASGVLTSSRVNKKTKAKAKAVLGKGKGSKSVVKDKVTYSLTVKEIKANISVIANVRVLNAEWIGQTKKAVTAHSADNTTKIEAFKVTIDDSNLERMKKWNLVRRLEMELKKKKMDILKDTDAKKNHDITVRKGKICAWAGTLRWRDTILIIFEGDSAMQYANIIRKCHPNGYNMISLLPTGGKIKNTTDCRPEDLVKNTFFVEFKSAMGICEGVDYSTAAGFNTLKHGCIYTMCDADVDGYHIKGLLLNLIMTCYPSLLSNRGFIKEFKTKSSTAKRGKVIVKFFSEFEFESWKEHTPDWEKWEVTHYKGLGTSTKEEAVDDWNDQYVIDIDMDVSSMRYMSLAFKYNEQNVIDKKGLIDSYNRAVVKPHTHVPKGGVQYISKFVCEDLVTYMIADIVRHLPKRDGFTPTSRKIIHVATKVWKWWTSAQKERLVAFSYDVMKKTDYHHGDLTGVVVSMTQDFVCANNIPYFNPLGMYGSREVGGKDCAAARYPFISTNNIWSHVIKGRDVDLLNYLPAEKKGTIEPSIYYPTIPHFLINGVNALMSAYRSFIPKYNPFDITSWFKLRLRGIISNRRIVPWYRGYRGTITVVDKRVVDNTMSECVSEKLVEDEDGNTVVKNVVRAPSELKGKYFMLSKGLVTITAKDEGIVTELPIGVWTQSYMLILEKMKKRGIITSYRDISTLEEDVKIKVSGFTKVGEKGVCFDDFKITKCTSMSSMKLLDDNNTPISFNTVEDIMEDYYRWRYPKYVRRRELDIKKVATSIDKITSKIEYIKAVMDGKLMTKGRREKDVVIDMERLGLDPVIYLGKKVSEKSFSVESAYELQQKREGLRHHLISVEATTPESIWLNDIEEFEAAIRRLP